MNYNRMAAASASASASAGASKTNPDKWRRKTNILISDMIEHDNYDVLSQYTPRIKVQLEIFLSLKDSDVVDVEQIKPDGTKSYLPVRITGTHLLTRNKQRKYYSPSIYSKTVETYKTFVITAHKIVTGEMKIEVTDNDAFEEPEPEPESEPESDSESDKKPNTEPEHHPLLDYDQPPLEEGETIEDRLRLIDIISRANQQTALEEQSMGFTGRKSRKNKRKHKNKKNKTMKK